MMDAVDIRHRTDSLIWNLCVQFIILFLLNIYQAGGVNTLVSGLSNVHTHLLNYKLIYGSLKFEDEFFLGFFFSDFQGSLF